MESPLKILHRESFQAGAVIIHEGEPGTRAFIIETGKVVIWRDLANERRTLGVVGEGGIFGEMALIDDQPRMASVSAIIDTTCVIINHDLFKSKIDAADPFLVGLLRIFVRNIRSLTTMTEEDAAAAADGDG